MPPTSDTKEARRKALAKKRQEKQEKYWADRAQTRVLATDRQGDAIRKETDRAYRDARDRIRAEIDKFYRDFAGVAGVTESEARLKLSRGELKDFQAELERKRGVIQEMIKANPDNRRLKAYDREFDKLSKVRALTRQEALEANVAAEIVKLGGSQEASITSHVKSLVRQTLSMSADDLKAFGDVETKPGMGDVSQVTRAARENWQHGDFSSRIWDDKDKLISETRQIIETGFAHHKGAYEMGTDLMNRMNTSHYKALRVVRTEFNHLSNQAALAEYKAKGIKKYKFVAALDARTSDICEEMNGQIFNVADAKTGRNFPPMHPNCRSTTVPVVDWGDPDEWDFSKIELDDSELAELGMDEYEVRALDKSAPRNPEARALPALSVQDANQAASDTESVSRRAERDTAIREQGERIEEKARAISSTVDDIDHDIDFYQRSMEGAEMVTARAALEVENLEAVSLKIQKAELELAKLQARASKLDDEVPKPDPNLTDQLQSEIDARTKARKARKEKDPPYEEVIQKAMPDAFDVDPETEPVAPRTAFGRAWAQLKDKVSRAKERFNAWFADCVDDMIPRDIRPSKGLPAGARIVDVDGVDQERANKHAKIYYEAVRHKKNDVFRISENTGLPIEDIQRIKSYLFLEEHELEDNGIRRFFPDFMIAQSWQRLESGKEIQSHDLTLLRHELEERRLMLEEGLSQAEAHTQACRKYDYPAEATAFYDSLKKHKKTGRMD